MTDAPCGSHVEARQLLKRYGDRTAVDKIDLDIFPGESVGILGPNGAGKTSCMRMIGCVSRPSGGRLRVLGTAVAGNESNLKRRLGVVPQEDNLDLDLTVRENLLIYARYFGLSWRAAREKAAKLLDFVQLGDRAHDKVEHLSGGMKRRLTIARALVNEPSMLLLDEPTTGLDPQARQAVWDKFYSLKSQGVTLVTTTHNMDEVEQLCDRMVIMNAGHIIAEGSPQQLVGQYSTREVVELRFGPGAAGQLDGQLRPLVQRVEVLRDRTLLYTDDGDRAAAEVHKIGLEPTSVLVRRSCLEDVFLRLTGRALID